MDGHYEDSVLVAEVGYSTTDEWTSGRAGSRAEVRCGTACSGPLGC
jgi:hypothetical protein